MMPDVLSRVVVLLRAAVLIMGIASAPALAQEAQPPGDAAAEAPAAAPVTTPASRPAQVYPPDPLPFRRGNPAASGLNWYFSLWKVLFLVGLFLLWTHTSNWVSEDSRGLKVRPLFWNTTVFVSGLAALLLFFTIPRYAGGVFIGLMGCGVPLGLYINERNQRVPESGKVMTPRHLRGFAQRQLGKLGVQFRRGDRVEEVLGPGVKFLGKTKTGRVDHSRSRQVENSKGYVSARELVYDAVMRRATDIHLEPKEEELAIRLRVDGVMYPTEPFDRAVGDAVVNIFKVLSAMDITERRRAQDGSFGAELEGREIDFRVASQGTREGEKMVIRILDQANSVSRLEQLGMRKQMQDAIDSVIHEPHGMFLCCGPTGAGKSTTLYACLNELDSYQKNIITIEDPIEYKMDNVTQIEINTKADQTFGGSLRSVLRQDPDVVMVGEIRDGETAKIACQAANTGHMVFSTVHANDTITALLRLIDLEVDPTMLATSITAILGQRLARRLCLQCREDYQPNPDFLKKAGLPPSKVEKFYRPPQEPTNCTHCGDLGYKGRIGVYELLTINDRIRDLVREKGSVTNIRGEARKNGMLSMKEEGLRLVIRGVTSIDELMRVVK
jgi:type II secretory ATPase GspE/PulE/Tfp pilus assembly ATPase PilB-like protein